MRLRHRKGRQAWEEILRSSATLSQSHFFSHSLLQALRLADDSNCLLIPSFDLKSVSVSTLGFFFFLNSPVSIPMVEANQRPGIAGLL